MVKWTHCCVLYAFMLSALLRPSYQHGQPSQHEEHGHGHNDKPLQFASEIHNAQHILDHLQKVVSTKPKDQMTEEELEFHYFKLHDYDNNNKLDGVEIGKALTHFHDENDKSPGSSATPARSYSDTELSEVIDAALATDDLDGDGYVEYPEFMAAHARRYEEDGPNEPGPPGTFEVNGPHAPGYEQEGAPLPPGV